jgi:hypothetical protein
MRQEKVKRIEVCRTEDYAGRTDEGYPMFRTAWAVVADLEDGRQFAHRVYFRDEGKAAELAELVRIRETINLKHWEETTPMSYEELELQWDQIAVREHMRMPL